MGINENSRAIPHMHSSQSRMYQEGQAEGEGGQPGTPAPAEEGAGTHLHRMAEIQSKQAVLQHLEPFLDSR